MAEPYLQQLGELIEELALRAQTRYTLEPRHFFGGAALYADGSICASLSPAGLALKLPDDTCAELLAHGDARPLQYFEGGRVKKGYVVLSQALREDRTAVCELFRSSFGHVTNA